MPCEQLTPIEVAEKYRFLQLRSVLDEIDQPPDYDWVAMVSGDAVVDSVETHMTLSLPSSAEAEDRFLEAVEYLVDAIATEEGLVDFYKKFGDWSDADAYFLRMGSNHVMFVDVDNNDLDDRLAIVLLAFQLASANAERRLTKPAEQAMLFLDCRSWETTRGLVVWRSMRLAWVLNQELCQHGLTVRVVVRDTGKAFQAVASHLGLQAAPEMLAHALELEMPGVAATLLDSAPAEDGEATEVEVGLLGDWIPHGAQVSVWVLSGLCDIQVQDIRWLLEKREASFIIFEQAPPAWQSLELPAMADTIQPHWMFPPCDERGCGYGAEPSNIRAGEQPYPAATMAYLRLQHLVSERRDRFEYVIHALSRKGGFMPAPPGKAMIPIAARPLNVMPGEAYLVKRALDPTRAQEAFARLMDVARSQALAQAPFSLYTELCVACEGDDGEPRPCMNTILRHGTYMSDGIAVALGIRCPDSSAAGVRRVVRRLALVTCCPQPAPQSPDEGEPTCVGVSAASADATSAGAAGALDATVSCDQAKN